MDQITEYITDKDMSDILKARAKIDLAIAKAEKAASDAKIADLEYRSLVQHIYIRYGMTLSDQINDTDGKIIRATKVDEPTVEVAEESK